MVSILRQLSVKRLSFQYEKKISLIALLIQHLTYQLIHLANTHTYTSQTKLHASSFLNDDFVNYAMIHTRTKRKQARLH